VRWALAAGLLVVVWARPALASPSLTPQSELDAGRVDYERGNYAEAVKTIQPLLYPKTELESQDSVVEAHRLLALSYFFMKQEPEAEHEVASLLALRPNYELDPVVDPPEAVRFFAAIRKKQETELREIRQRQLEEEERARKEAERKKLEAHAKAERVYMERTVEHHTRAIALLPFGAGQFYNHHRVAGALFLSAEALAAIWWGAMTLTIYVRYPNSQVAHNDIDFARTLQGLQIGAGAAFWAVVVAGIIDAQVRYVPQFVHETRELPAQPQKKSSPKNTKMTMAPLIAPGLYGLGVQGAF
jgi:hypothetical protein